MSCEQYDSPHTLNKSKLTFFRLVDINKSLGIDIVYESRAVLHEVFDDNFQSISYIAIKVVLYLGLSSYYKLGGLPSWKMLLNQKPLVAIFLVFAVEYFKLLVGPELFIDIGVEMVDVSDVIESLPLSAFNVSPIISQFFKLDRYFLPFLALSGVADCF